MLETTQTVVSELNDARELIEHEEDDEMREFAQEEADALAEEETTLLSGSENPSAAQRPQRRKECHPGDQGGYRWRRSRSLCRRPLQNVRAICRKKGWKIERLSESHSDAVVSKKSLR